MKDKIKPIALYLPQYHEIPENNEWWGKGFTEWSNVKKATSLFGGHYQPHVPIDNNYYNLNDNEVLIKQAKLAKEYGIYGFCFYHYWFNGKLLLEKPIENLLAAKEPNFPFCLCWANENWTRTWDGQDKQVLMKQDYSLNDDLNHIKYLIPFFKDDRYIKIDGKPVFLMYRTELHPQIKEATEIWRNEVKKAGFPDLYLIRMENFERGLNPKLHGFDAGMEFAPDSTCRGKKAAKSNMLKYVYIKLLHNWGLKKSAFFKHQVFSYPKVSKNMTSKAMQSYTYFRCICPSWDNSARRKKDATIYINSTPKLFGKWANLMKEYTQINMPENKQFFFINAWNEWGEGCHLEPDEKYGTEYLEELQKIL
ncbi:MAG: glycosyl hydrolase [Sphingobacteriales bacterium]|nr:MAG: glycosyl hydrolase [Sphingobacteriales bacterium]